MAPDPKLFFMGTGHQSALSKLSYGVQSCSPGILITGPHGVGKTFVSRLLVQALPQEKYNVGLLFNPPLGSDQLLPELMYQLGVPLSNGSSQEHLRELSDRIITDQLRGVHTLLIVDEGQLLPEVSLEQLRILANYQMNEQSPLTLVLCGLPELRGSLSRNVALLQRFSLSIAVPPLRPRETIRYVLHRLKCAGAVRAIFSEEALYAIHGFSDGVPRLINTLCDSCLLQGWVDRQVYIEKGLVEQVARASAFRVASPAGRAESSQAP